MELLKSDGRIAKKEGYVPAALTEGHVAATAASGCRGSSGDPDFAPIAEALRAQRIADLRASWPC